MSWPHIRLGFIAEPTYTVKALDESTWAAFATLVERNNGIFGGCWCMGFHDDDSRTDPGHNRSAKERRVREGRAHAALVYEGESAWAGANSAHPTRCRGSRAAPRTTRVGRPRRTGGSRAVTSVRGTGVGVATTALAGALDLIAGLGGGAVEGYPEGADAVPAGFLFNGALLTYEKLGFIRDRKIGKHRWVVTRVVGRGHRKRGPTVQFRHRSGVNRQHDWRALPAPGPVVTATVTATRAANASLPQPRTARPCSMLGLSWASAPPEKTSQGLRCQAAMSD